MDKINGDALYKVLAMRARVCRAEHRACRQSESFRAALSAFLALGGEGDRARLLKVLQDCRKQGVPNSDQGAAMFAAMERWALGEYAQALDRLWFTYDVKWLARERKVVLRKVFENEGAGSAQGEIQK